MKSIILFYLFFFPFLLFTFFMSPLCHAAILIESPNGTLTQGPSTMSAACAQSYPVHITSAISSSFSNISSSIVHGCGAPVVCDAGGSINPTTAFRLFNQQNYPITPELFGAKGDNSTDDSTAFAKTIFAAPPGSSVNLTGNYTVSKHTGVNDRWGININKPLILYSNNGASIKRNTPILAGPETVTPYPIILIGVPDSAPTSIFQGVTIRGITFNGSDVRHTLSGEIPHDFRDAIEIRNASNVTIRDNIFNGIESSAIFTTYPGYDYSNTKVYKLEINNNTFNVVANSVMQRALTKAVVLSGTDDAKVHNNTFNNCDTAVQGIGTYETPDQVETTTWVSAIGPVMRGGRGWVIDHNYIFGSSEHALYLTGMDVAVTSNVLRIFNYTTQLGNIKIRSRNAVVSGNTITALNNGILLDCPSFNVSVTGNSIFSVYDDSSGQIDISSYGLSSFITISSSGYFSSFLPMGNFSVTGNTLYRTSAPESNGYGTRIYTDISDSNYPFGQIQNVVITGNTYNYPRVGMMMINNLVKDIIYSNNVLQGKAFFTNSTISPASGAFSGTGSVVTVNITNHGLLTGETITTNGSSTSGYNVSGVAITATDANHFTFAGTGTGTPSTPPTIALGFTRNITLNSVAMIGVDGQSTTALTNVTASGNSASGFYYLVGLLTGAASANTIQAPRVMNNNKLDYIQFFKSQEIIIPGYSNQFSGNSGVYFLDRLNFPMQGLNNSLGDGYTATSFYKSTLYWSGAHLLYFPDDSGSGKQLDN